MALTFRSNENFRLFFSKEHSLVTWQLKVGNDHVLSNLISISGYKIRLVAK